MKTYFYFFLGFAVVFVAALIVRLLLRKDCAKYDERQILAQNMAYTAAYCVLVFYCAAFVPLEKIGGPDWFDTYTGICLGIFLSVLVFAVICITKDAFFHGAESPALLIFLFLAAGAVNIFIGFQGVLSGKDTWVILFAGVMFLTVAVTALVKRIADRKRDADE